MAAPVLGAHPNAAAAGGSGGVGVLIVWALGHFGVDVSAEVGAVIAASAATVALVVGRNGIRGIARIIWRGLGAALLMAAMLNASWGGGISPPWGS